MMNEKLRQVIELLKAKTIDKKAIWNKSSGGSQFKLSINDGSAITIGDWSDNYNQFFEVVIYNSNGDAIERFNTENSEGVSADDYKLLQSFHKAASDSYYKVEETMDALFTSIKSQDIIGTSDEGTKAPDVSIEEDDLPF